MIAEKARLKKLKSNIEFVGFFSVTSITHRLQIFDDIKATFTFWNDMVYGHQFKFVCIQIDMKTAVCVSSLDEINAFFMTIFFYTPSAMHMKNT